VAQPYLRQLGRVGPVQIWEVDGLWVRHHGEPDFNNFGSYPRFQSIPRDEFWLDREVNHDERRFYLANLVAERKARQQGRGNEQAREVGNAAERQARAAAKPTRPADVAASVKLRQIGAVQGVAIWLVNGKAVRDHLFQEFTEGGHDLVYDWIPKNEVWLDDTVVLAERKLVLQHELHERKLMNQGMEYEQAHGRALRVEDKVYRQANPSWWGTDSSGHQTKPADPRELVSVQQLLDEFDDLLGIACADGNWNYDPYMHGMANGMILMRSMVSGEEPKYLDAPEEWLEDRPTDRAALQYQAGFREARTLCAAVPRAQDVAKVYYHGHTYRLAYPSRPPSWNIAKQQLFQASKQLEQTYTILHKFDFSSDNAYDFFGGEGVHQGEAVTSILSQWVQRASAGKMQWWVKDGSFAQLQDFFHGVLSDDYAAGKQLEQRQAKLMQALKDKYQNYDLVFDPKHLIPADPKIAAEWEDYHQFSTKIVPAIQAVLAIPAALAAVKKFSGYVDREIAYKQHAYKTQRDDGGDPRPPGVEAHEVMWHATVAYRAILREGFKLRSEQADASAGLGGSMTTKKSEGISFTASYEIAEGIAAAYHDMVTMLQQPQTAETIKQYVVGTLGLDYDEFMQQIRSLFNPRLADPNGTYSLVQVYNFVRYGLAYSDYAGVRYDPLFMDEGGSPEKLAKLNPADIGIIEVVIDTTQEEAVYKGSMEEWRVPKAAILSFGPVGSQQVSA
jgi:hypothetical protein